MSPTNVARRNGPALALTEGEEILFRAQPVAGLTWLVYVVTLGLYEIWRRAKCYTLTNQRVVSQKGIITRTVQSIPIAHVQDVVLRTQIGFGQLQFASAGPSVLAFAATEWMRSSDARGFHEALLRELSRNHESRGAPPHQVA